MRDVRFHPVPLLRVRFKDIFGDVPPDLKPNFLKVRRAAWDVPLLVESHSKTARVAFHGYGDEEWRARLPIVSAKLEGTTPQKSPEAEKPMTITKQDLDDASKRMSDQEIEAAARAMLPEITEHIVRWKRAKSWGG